MGWYKNIINKIMNKVKEDDLKEIIRKEIKKFYYGDIEDDSSSKLKSATYYACMQIRCNSIAKLPIKLMEETNAGSIKAIKHNLYRILKNRPNSFTTPHDFIWATEFQRLEYGNAYWFMKSDKKGNIKELFLLDSSNMEVYIDEDSDTKKVFYIYEDPKQGSLVYSSDDIVHFKNFSLNGIEGTSIKKYISQVISNEQYSTKVLNERYKTGLQDPIIVEFDGDLNEAKSNKIKKKFMDLGGAKMAGQVVPIPFEFKVKQIETKLVNSQFFELQGLTTKHIANAFGVKGFQLNDIQKGTYNNIEQQNKAYYSDTLQNSITQYEQEMNYKLLSEKDQSKYYWKFNVDSILRSDLETRSKSHQIAINTGYKTIAEVRNEEDLPYIEGTDMLIIGNGASIPLKDLGKQYKEGG